MHKTTVQQVLPAQVISRYSISLLPLFASKHEQVNYYTRIYGKSNSQQQTNSSWECEAHCVKSLAENVNIKLKNTGVFFSRRSAFIRSDLSDLLTLET